MVTIAILYKNLIWLQQSRLKTLFPEFLKYLAFKMQNTLLKDLAPPCSIFLYLEVVRKLKRIATN